MACSRGKAAPKQNTKLRLFSACGGYCQNPSCERELFLDTGSKQIHIAEIAHVFAASDGGPRTDGKLTLAERGDFKNLIVLCSACHTMVDKAEQDFPPERLEEWKRNHENRLQCIFGAIHCVSREEVRAVIKPLLEENQFLFKEYNPSLPYHENPESELAFRWKKAMRERIIPNSRRMLATLDVNKKFMVSNEPLVVERFRNHLQALEARHLTDIVIGEQPRFPVEFTNVMA